MVTSVDPAAIFDLLARFPAADVQSQWLLTAADGQKISHASSGLPFPSARLSLPEATARRLGALAGLPLEQPPRLERLRVFVGPRDVMMLTRCRAVPLPAGGHGVLVELGGEIVQPVVKEEVSSPIATAGAAPAWAAEPAGERRPIRFVFTLDEGGKLRSISTSARDLFGESTPSIGDPLAAVAGSAFAMAIEAGQTFAGLRAMVPIAGTGFAVPVTFGGSPLRDTSGWSGFGMAKPAEAAPVSSEQPLEKPDQTKDAAAPAQTQAEQDIIVVSDSKQSIDPSAAGVPAVFASALASRPAADSPLSPGQDFTTFLPAESPDIQPNSALSTAESRLSDVARDNVLKDRAQGPAEVILAPMPPSKPADGTTADREMSRPDLSQPEWSAPDPTRSDPARPDLAEPDTPRPEIAMADAIRPEAARAHIAARLGMAAAEGALNDAEAAAVHSTGSAAIDCTESVEGAIAAAVAHSEAGLPLEAPPYPAPDILADTAEAAPVDAEGTLVVRPDIDSTLEPDQQARWSSAAEVPISEASGDAALAAKAQPADRTEHDTLSRDTGDRTDAIESAPERDVLPPAAVDQGIAGRKAVTEDAAQEAAGQEALRHTGTPQGEPAEAEAGQDTLMEARAPEAATSNIVALPARPGPADGPRQEPPRIVPIKPGSTPVMPGASPSLSHSERNAFREIAKALGARLEEEAQGAGFENGAQGAVGENAPRTADVAADAAMQHADGAMPDAAFPTEDDGPAAAMLHPVSAASAASPPASNTDSSMADPAEAPVFLALLDKLPIGLLVLRGEKPLFANRTLLDLAGFADLASLQAPGGLDRLFRGRPDRLLPRGVPETVALMGPDGKPLPVDAHLQVITWAGGPASLISFRRALDVEKGPRARSLELDLQARENEVRELSAMLNTATDGVVNLDGEGRIIAMNRSAEALFGYDQNEVVGEMFTLLLAPESHTAALDYLDGLKVHGVKSLLNDGREVVGRERKGGRLPLFMTIGRITETAPLKLCAVLRDLTAWKRAENELTEARRAAERASAKKSDFLAKVSHEIRTPMNAIIGFAEVMRDERLGPIGSERYKDYLADIHASGQHVVSLVNDLLDLSKIEAGRMELTFTSVDLNSIVGSCVGIMQPQANRDRVLVRSQLTEKLPPVVADERSVRQIVLNLLSNASKFTEPGGQVIISTAWSETGEAIIRVRDTGIGMNPKELEAALEPFRQVGTLRKQGGTGLGLPLTKALVEANRATFAIRSAPGEGTLVEVVFPATRVLAE